MVAVEVNGMPNPKASLTVMAPVLDRVIALWKASVKVADEVLGRPSSKDSAAATVSVRGAPVVICNVSARLAAEVRRNVTTFCIDPVTVTVELLGNPRPKDSLTVTVDVGA